MFFPLKKVDWGLGGLNVSYLQRGGNPPCKREKYRKDWELDCRVVYNAKPFHGSLIFFHVMFLIKDADI